MMEKSQIPYDTMSTTSTTSNAESVFNKCCCCIPLRIGCFILGYISLVVNLIRTISVMGVTLYCGMKTYGYSTVAEDSPFKEETIRQQKVGEENIQVFWWIFLIITILDLIWLAINISCLVGVHKKRPGPIRVFVGVATFRLALTLAGYMYAYTSSMQSINPPDIMAHFIDLALTAYFIFVYYMYAVRLEKEAEAAVGPHLPQVPQVHIQDVSFIYPSKLDKEHLVL